MRRLQANGYYLAHNHPSDNARASRNDIKLTEEFYRRIKGFKGHLIVNTDTYAWISIDSSGKGFAENYLKINKGKTEKFQKKTKEKGIYDLKITSREDLVSFISSVKINKN